MSEFEKQVLADLAVLKSQMAALLGNGQPGRLRDLEVTVESHEKFVQNARGIGALLAVVITAVHFAIDFFSFRR